MAKTSKAQKNAAKPKAYVVKAEHGTDSGVGVQTRKIVLWTHPHMGACLDTPARRVMSVSKAEVLRAVDAFFAGTESKEE